MKKKENDRREKENNGLDSSLKPLKLILKETKAKNNFAIRSLRKKKRKPLIDKDWKYQLNISKHMSKNIYSSQSTM